MLSILKKLEHPVILVRPETRPDDVHGMLAAQGVITSRGGRTSHAALVARQFGIPAVVGIVNLEVDVERRQMRTPTGLLLKEGEPALFRATGAPAGGATALRYQWRRNGIDIAGADKSWLRLERVSLSDDGNRYTVVVGAGPMAIESKPCALRVFSASTALSADD